MSVSEDEMQLSQLSCVGQSTDATAKRVTAVKDATRRLNEMANSVRRIVADIDWRGEANDAAQTAFIALAHQLNEHADTITALAEADDATQAPMHQAYLDYDTLQGITPDKRVLYAGVMNPGETIEQFRARQAKGYRESLDSAMHAAQAKIVNGATWDLNPPAPASPTTPPKNDPKPDPKPDPKGDGGGNHHGNDNGNGNNGSGGSGAGGSGGSGAGGSGGSGAGGSGGAGTGGGYQQPDQSAAHHGGGHQDAQIAPAHHGGHTQDVLHAGDGHHGGGGNPGAGQHGQWQDGSGHHVQWQDAQGQWHEVAAQQLQWQDAQGQWHDAGGHWQDANGQWHAVAGQPGGDAQLGLHHGNGDQVHPVATDGAHPADGGHGNGGHGDGGQGNGAHGNGAHGGSHGDGAQGNGHHQGGDGQAQGDGQQLRWKDADGQWHVVDAGQLQWQDGSGAWHDGDGEGPGGAWQQVGEQGQQVPDSHLVGTPGASVWSSHVVEQTFTDGAGPSDASPAPAPVAEPVAVTDLGAVKVDHMAELARRLGGDTIPATPGATRV